MLEAMRRGAQTWVAKLLFAILVFAFATWGVADVFTGWGRGSIAKVGDTGITAEEYSRAFQSELEKFSRQAGNRLTAEQGRAIGLDRRVLGQLIGGAAVEQHATSLGLALSDKTLADMIANDPDFKDATGKFSKESFAGILRQIGLSEQAFLRLRRKDELRTQVFSAFVKGQTVPKPMLETMHAYNQEKRVIEWLNLDAQKSVTVAEPDEAKLKELYEAGKSNYMTQEYRKFETLFLSLDDLKKQVEIKDEDIAKAYEETKESYNTPEQRRVQQIAFKDKASAEAAKKALEDASKSFGDVAKEAGAKDTDADLGLIAKKALIDPKIANAAFSLEKDKISDVVEGRFATVLVRVTQIEPGVVKSLADVKDQVKDKLAAEKAKALIQTKHDEIDDNRSAGKTLKEIADILKLTYTEVAASDRRGMTPDNKPVMDRADISKIVDLAFSPDGSSDQPPAELADGGYAWVNMLSTDAPKQKTFEEVKDEVKARHLENERVRLLTELSAKLAERVNAGEPLTAIEAAAFGTTQKTEAITRATIPQGLAEAAVAQAFVLTKGKAGSADSSDKQTRTVFRVIEVTPVAAPTKDELDKLAKTMEMDLSNQTLTEYTEALKSRLGANVNEAELKRALGITEQ